MTELLSHLLEREGAIEHFYCDHRGLVTIAIGYLVDRDGGPSGAGSQLARTLASRADVKFVNAAGAVADVDAVLADWQRVKEHGRQKAGLPARGYASIAHLRIDRATIDSITGAKVRSFLDDLYQKRPFILNLPVQVAMALIDCRYNPAGVALYSDDPRLRQLWAALDDSHAQFNPDRAVQLFQQIWAGRGGDRYGLRHQHRVAWLREGLRPTPASPTSTTA
jgi:hypothetical protein